MRIAFAILSLCMTSTCLADDRAFDLLEIGRLGGKGRIQDQEYYLKSPQVSAILAMGKEAIPLLTEALESERPYDKPPLDFWPQMVEGDVALVVLSDLFLDPTWRQSTLPELCWNNLLERTSDSATAWELLNDFVKAHGRAELARRWRQAWAQYGSKLRWDSRGKYFRVEGRELTACTPGKSPALEASDNLAAWESAAMEERGALARSLVTILPKPYGREPTLADTRFLINCISMVAPTGNKNATVKDVAKECWRMVR